MLRLKWIMLGAYLILSGLGMLGVSLGGEIVNTITGLCAVLAGFLFLVTR